MKLNESIERIKNNDPSLTSLNHGFNMIGDSGAEALAESLATNTTLTSLNLECNKIGDSGAEALAESLATNTTLTSLNLGSNIIGDYGAKALAGALTSNTTLTSLNLECYIISDSGAEALAESLVTNTTLTSLNLGSNIIGDYGAKALAGALTSNATLTSLNLGSNIIGNSGVKALIESLAINTTLINLNLWSNELGDSGAEALAGVLTSNATLTSLNLECNKIGDSGAKALAASLATNTTLTSLYLGSNKLGYSGAKALAASLATNTTLTSLDLRFNMLGDSGAKALAGALTSNATLTSLNLGSNNIGEPGAKALAGALTSNTTLTSLNLGSNNIGNSGAKALAESLATNTTLTSLNLGDNELSDSGVSALAEALENNFTLLRLDGVTHSDISNYLKRNNAITDCLRQLMCSMDNPAIMDVDLIEKNLRDLEALIPSLGCENEALDDEHPATEAYRLLTALGYRLQEDIEDKSRARCYLSAPFKSVFLQAIADRALGELLYHDILPQAPEGEEKTALLYSVLYRLGSSAQWPENAIIIYDILLQLKVLEGTSDPVRIRELQDKAALLNHQAIVTLAKIALISLKARTDNKTDEKALALLTTAQNSKNVSPEIIQDLMSLPVFIDVLKTEYPRKNQVVCLGSYQMPYTMIYNLPARDSVTLEWVHMEANLKSNIELLKNIKEAIHDYLGWMTANTQGTRGLTRFSHWYHGESGIRRARELFDRANNPNATYKDIVNQLAHTLDESSNARHSLKRYLETAIGKDKLTAILNDLELGDTCQYSC